MQGLADGHFIIPYTLGHYYATEDIVNQKVGTDHPEFDRCLNLAKDRFGKLLSVGGRRSVDSFHKELGRLMWEYVGMSRNERGLQKAIGDIAALREEFWKDLRVTGGGDGINVELEKANRVADFMELGELMARDALDRRESCGGHFREESQTEENEAKRDDENFCHVAAWEYKDGGGPVRHVEELAFEYVPLSQRSYK